MNEGPAPQLARKTLVALLLETLLVLPQWPRYFIAAPIQYRG
jgi:hypothetical protein